MPQRSLFLFENLRALKTVSPDRKAGLQERNFCMNICCNAGLIGYVYFYRFISLLIRTSNNSNQIGFCIKDWRTLVDFTLMEVYCNYNQSAEFGFSLKEGMPFIRIQKENSWQKSKEAELLNSQFSIQKRTESKPL